MDKAKSEQASIRELERDAQSINLSLVLGTSSLRGVGRERGAEGRRRAREDGPGASPQLLGLPGDQQL